MLLLVMTLVIIGQRSTILIKLMFSLFKLCYLHDFVAYQLDIKMIWQSFLYVLATFHDSNHAVASSFLEK